MVDGNYSAMGISKLILSRFLLLAGKNCAKITLDCHFTTDLHPWLRIFHPDGVIAGWLLVVAVFIAQSTEIGLSLLWCSLW